ncbi:phage holin [Escherichia coli]|uniref:phage holin n=1 Tax=Escherichia coli TaxID=562 RepID=UPI0001F91526|nr:lysis protein [Escherichia coli]EFZ73079.1 lysis protein S family protein [Escherichia coli RN587/1]EHC2235102.1 lysis protein [Escherichia coli]EII88518.1 lysis protein S [Escherichia coli 3003]EKI27343.1 lysis S family protein [Escherichia coli ARS4.2123]
MYQMEKITTGVSYTTSVVGTGYWLLQLLDKVSPSQWVAIGVLGSARYRVAGNTDVITYKCQPDGMLKGWSEQPDTQKTESGSGFCVAI